MSHKNYNGGVMRNLSLATKILIGFAVGIILGILFKDKILFIKPIGDLFLTLIKMLVVPLVFFSITSGITSLSDIQRLKRIGIKTVLYFLGTTVLAGVIGLTVAHIFKPGENFNISFIPGATTASAQEIPSLANTILGMFPSNPIASLASGNLIQIIIFSLFLGHVLI